MQKSVTADQLKEVEELEERVKLLTDLDSYKDPGTPSNPRSWNALNLGSNSPSLDFVSR